MVLSRVTGDAPFFINQREFFAVIELDHVEK